jgi:hypothetical protein
VGNWRSKHQKIKIKLSSVGPFQNPKQGFYYLIHTSGSFLKLFYGLVLPNCCLIVFYYFWVTNVFPSVFKI